MIPKIIHQIWVGGYEIPTRERYISNQLKENHSDYEYFLWTDNNLPEIPENLKEMYHIMYENKDYVFCADMLRWLVVYNYGGWYLDIDWEYISNLNTLPMPTTIQLTYSVQKLICRQVSSILRQPGVSMALQMLYYIN